MICITKQSTWEQPTIVKRMYDVFLISNGTINIDAWTNFKQKYPNAQKVENCESFQQVAVKSLTKHFWAVWDNLELNNEFQLDYKILEWDNDYIHVFKNGNYYDGVCIFPKHAKVLQREWDYRFFTNKKEIDIVASDPKPYDVAFISYKEKFAENNYKKLLKRVPYAQWTRDVKGIHQAHIEAAKLATTEMFYIVDADAEVVDEFNFDMQIPYYDFNARNSVYVWRSRNPVNNLEYGYGGVKLFPRQKTINMDTTKPDMTTSISESFRPMDTVANSTVINTDAFTAWKSAFRECVKLSSRTIDRQDDTETTDRLDVWCTVGKEKPYGEYTIRGANEGREYGKQNSNNIEALYKINDFAWLKERFDER